MNVCMYVMTQIPGHMWRSKTIFGSRFSPPTTWVTQMRLRLSGLAASAFYPCCRPTKDFLIPGSSAAGLQGPDSFLGYKDLQFPACGWCLRWVGDWVLPTKLPWFQRQQLKESTDAALLVQGGLESPQALSRSQLKGISFFFFFFFFFRDRVSLYGPGCPGTHLVDQAGFQLRNPPASASRVLGLKRVPPRPAKATLKRTTFNWGWLTGSEIQSSIIKVGAWQRPTHSDIVFQQGHTS
jgi:hypothetical protein